MTSYIRIWNWSGRVIHNVDVKLYLIKHHAMKIYEGMEI
jgi:hypothetical protein